MNGGGTQATGSEQAVPEHPYPIEHQVFYVGGWASLGGFVGGVLWQLLARGNDAWEGSAGDWVTKGMVIGGCLGIALLAVDLLIY